MTEEGAQYFRVIHDNQQKTCRICRSAELELKNCPQFLCWNGLEQGHYARDCKAPQCQGCRKALLRRTCETDEEEHEEMEMELIKEQYLKLKEAAPLQWIKSIEDKETRNEKPQIFFLKK